MGQQSEGIRISLEVDQVVPEDGTHLTLEVATWAFEEKSLDGLLATMSEGRIAQVVSQTGRGDNLSDLLKEGALQFGVLAYELGGYIVAQRHAHTGYLEGMSQTVMNEDATREGEHLCLVLQATERGRENETIVVAFELRTVIVTLGVAILLPQSLIGYQLLPIHHTKVQRYKKSAMMTQIWEKILLIRKKRVLLHTD